MSRSAPNLSDITGPAAIEAFHGRQRDVIETLDELGLTRDRRDYAAVGSGAISRAG